MFFNNCHYICNRLVTIQTDLQKRTTLRDRALNEFNFANFLAELRIISAGILEQHLIQIRRQISTAIGNTDSIIFIIGFIVLQLQKLCYTFYFIKIFSFCWVA